MLRIGSRAEEHSGSVERPILRGVVQCGKAGEVGRLDLGAMGQQEPNRLGPIVDRGSVQGAAVVLRGAAVEPLDLCTVVQRRSEGGRVAGDRGVPKACRRSLGDARCRDDNASTLTGRFMGVGPPR